ncbi:hypothetical protein SAMN04487911_106116 [Arenibacter nanhaiticus]|uniref:Uncharacterized protein n=1 Tax=Arenibacter nanhaiticus TaxID=558155 RepID=A0A1M6EDA8_9FLAO|nr:hypothetical protein [Arenibacter nanhaiticus]SHI83454.1 hypothetical protein SAMN04487911_106116 [Arenibacter nanhaiticus]
MASEISQGISGAQIFSVSVLVEKNVAKTQEYPGNYVRVKYPEYIGSICWLSGTKHFINDIEKETSPHYKE